MKRILSLLAALALLMTTITAGAETLFSLLPVSQIEPVPNYGLMAGVDPVSEETLADGSTSFRYINVQAQSFLDFGTLLAEKGYAIDPDSLTVEGSAQTMNIIKDDIVFSVCYDQVALTLIVTYPEGANVEVYEEPDPFEGYVEIALNESVSVKSAGFHGTFAMQRVYAQSDIRTSMYGDPLKGIVVQLRLYNMAASAQAITSLFSNCTFHYINSDNHYQYRLYTAIFKRYEYAPNANHFTGPDGIFVEPLESVTEYMVTNQNVPDAVLNSTDGTIAVTFTFVPTGTNYIVYYRCPAE